jgi:hypothetical protein
VGWDDFYLNEQQLVKLNIQANSQHLDKNEGENNQKYKKLFIPYDSIIAAKRSTKLLTREV